MKKILTIGLSLFLFIFAADETSAKVYVAGSSAQLKVNKVENTADYRVDILKEFLTKHNSPLADYAPVFIETADKYGLDWRFVPAITGVESTFGKRIPTNSYNAYGWANGAYYFDSWEDSIEVVSKALREKYYDRGATSISKIARRYAPPSQTWGWKVRYFMDKIDPLPLSFTLEG
ncbi:hypothetical protein E3I18_02305 [Candidatus Woesebacteria bacterium]|nr:MAG: hypothetical protein E3I18_02305 [Candidatus Woesebacteria bacterium]